MKSSLPVFDIRKLETEALEEYIECPKFPTIVRQADHKDDTEFHCVPLIPFVGPPAQGADPFSRHFLVPKQEVHLVEDNVYGQFSVTKVQYEKDGPLFWLMSSTRSRMGFLLPFEKLRETELEPYTTDSFKPLQKVLTGWISSQIPGYT